MKKKETLRKNGIKNMILIIISMVMVATAFLAFYLTREKKSYATYQENSNIKYEVTLKENEFYQEDVLNEKQPGYVTTLIEKIPAIFQYDLKFSEDFSYRYSYTIVAEIDVLDKTTKTNIYHYSEELINNQLTEKTGNLKIEENIDIDYPKYDDIVNRFKQLYELTNTEAQLNVFLTINIPDINNSSTHQFNNKRVCSLGIPLGEKTVSIDLINDIHTNDNKIELKTLEHHTWPLIICAIYTCIAIIYIIYLIIYMKKTRTAQMIYDSEIKNILNNYDNYIQRINGSYDIGSSQVIRIETFEDILEIRDTLKQPILMLENEEKTGTFFIIPATNDIIYTYALRQEDIKTRLVEKEEISFDDQELEGNHDKKKKYTDEYLKEQISKIETTDEKNKITGTKHKEKNLYNQLEKTENFSNKKRKAK